MAVVYKIANVEVVGLEPHCWLRAALRECTVQWAQGCSAEAVNSRASQGVACVGALNK